MKTLLDYIITNPKETKTSLLKRYERKPKKKRVHLRTCKKCDAIYRTIYRKSCICSNCNESKRDYN